MRYDEIPDEQLPASRAARRFLRETWDDGLFTVEREPGGAYVAHFHDDGEAIPLRDMAYNAEIGLFRRSQFPHEPDDEE